MTPELTNSLIEIVIYGGIVVIGVVVVAALAVKFWRNITGGR